MVVKHFLIAAFFAAFLMPAWADDFEIGKPNSVSKITFGCWGQKEITTTFNGANFTPVVQGLMVDPTQTKQPLLTVWLHHLTGRAGVVISHPSGGECLVLVADHAQ